MKTSEGSAVEMTYKETERETEKEKEEKEGQE